MHATGLSVRARAVRVSLPGAATRAEQVRAPMVWGVGCRLQASGFRL